MKNPEPSDYQPGNALAVKVEAAGKRTTLVFVRNFSHPPSKVWLALTDPEHLREWAPFDANRNLGATGEAELTLQGTSTSHVYPSKVQRAEKPHVLEYTWGDDLLRWELEATDSGTRLTLHHTADEPTWIPKSATGWHICLDVAERALDGRPLGRIPAEDVRRFGWERLNAEYAEMLGIENTGWPEDIFPEPANKDEKEGGT